MPQKQADFDWCKFAPGTISAASVAFRKYAGETAPSPIVQRLVQRPGEKWTYDTDEEFFADYRRADVSGLTYYIERIGAFVLNVSFAPPVIRGQAPKSTVTVSLTEKYQVQAIFEVFESGRADSLIHSPPPPSPVIFIGHGHDEQWKLLRDHLQAQHGLTVVSYESAPRAGQFAANVVEGMARAANMAFLVHTAEVQTQEVDDADRDTEKRARDNVLHETGFFHRAFGLTRMIIVREEGCGGLSNLGGDQELRFVPGNIAAKFGDIVAVIRREFPQGW